MKTISRNLLLLLAMTCAVAAQKPTEPGVEIWAVIMNTCFHETILPAMKKDASFSAMFAYQHVDTDSKDEFEIETPIMFLDGKFRMEMNKIKGRSKDPANNPIPPSAVEGKDVPVIITCFKEKLSYVVFPKHKACYVDRLGGIPNPQFDNDGYKKTSAGKETVEGHPCTKYRATPIDVDGKEIQPGCHVMIWEADDLGSFPIRFSWGYRGEKQTVILRNVNRSKPSPDLFGAPAGYKQLDKGEMEKLFSHRSNEHNPTKP